MQPQMTFGTFTFSTSTFSLLLALSATLCFSTSSLVYAEYSKKVSVLWMNCFKAAVAFIALSLTVPLTGGWHSPAAASIAALMLSGLLGLNIGDLFLLSAYTHLGVARTLILFGFQPLFVGIAASFLFGQALDPRRFLAVIFLIACLATFSLERYKKEKRWDFKGLWHALAGVLLDTSGILLTRAAFEKSPEITPLEGNFYRCFAALIGFAVISRFRPVNLLQGLQLQPTRVKWILAAAGLAGTFLSLLFYLSAVKIGHLASITGIAITGPIFATALESILHKKPPSAYLLTAFAFFAMGFYILINAA